MPPFRCYFLDDGDHIEAAEVIEVADGHEAIEVALAALKARPQHRAVEIWSGAKLIYRSEETTPPGASPAAVKAN